MDLSVCPLMYSSIVLSFLIGIERIRNELQLALAQVGSNSPVDCCVSERRIPYPPPKKNRNFDRITVLSFFLNFRAFPMTIGLVLDMWTEKSNDDISYDRMATQEDFDKF